MNTVLTCILIILMGSFSALASYFNWDWYFNSRRARFFVQIFGRQGARVFYMVFGFFLIGMAIVIMIGD